MQERQSQPDDEDYLVNSAMPAAPGGMSAALTGAFVLAKRALRSLTRVLRRS